MPHEHDWIDVTTLTDIERQYICTGCDERKTGEFNPMVDATETISRRNDGFDGLRVFLAQMDPANNGKVIR
jgi:hypothetical protein